MSFLDELNSLFGCSNLYEIFGVEKTASDAEIKKAYRRLSLKVHPDRVGSEHKQNATKKFQAISKIHSLLSHKDLRKAYDETGEIGDEIVREERDWMYYWRLLFPKITNEDIEKFEKKYKDSVEELNDLKSAYIKCEGDMEGILENVLCSTEDDEGRFRKILQSAIDKGELPKLESFTQVDKKKRKARKQKAKQEAVEAEKLAKEMGVHGDNDLSALIAKRQNDRKSEMNNFLTNLEEKYAGTSQSKKRKIAKSKK